MADVIISPNMMMPVPIPGVDPGPDWANNVNACLSIIDGHNHALGTGVQVTPAGLNINTDLPILGNNLTQVRSIRFNPQGSPLTLPADVGVIYESGVDLYYNDGSGNQIRITQGGSVVGPTGSITGLTPPASVSYGFGTFVFESNVNTPANLDAGSIILRNIVANSHGLTLSPPAAMSADYTLTLPSLPASKEPVTLDTSGNFGTQRQLVWDIVVNSNLGSGGVGDFATIGSALGAATTGQSILVMTGTYTENVTVSKSVSLYGLGVGCIINGTLTIASGANDCLVEGFKVTGNITINSGVSEASLISFWLGSGSTLTNNGSGSFIQGMAE